MISSNEEGSYKSSKKRRSTGSLHERRFKCGCGKAYLSYPALYTHIKNKHENIHPANTVIPKSGQKKFQPDEIELAKDQSNSHENNKNSQFRSLSFKDIEGFLDYLGYQIEEEISKEDSSELIPLLDEMQFLNTKERSYCINTLEARLSKESQNVYDKINHIECSFINIILEFFQVLKSKQFLEIFTFLYFFRKELLSYYSSHKLIESYTLDEKIFEFYDESNYSSFCNTFFTQKLKLLKSYYSGNFQIVKSEIKESEDNCIIIFIKLISDLFKERGILKGKIEINTQKTPIIS